MDPEAPSGAAQQPGVDLADAVADRVYLMLPPAARPRIRQRLGQLTSRLPN